MDVPSLSVADAVNEGEIAPVHRGAKIEPPPCDSFTKAGRGYRWCDHCGRGMEGPDVCLGEIPGVSHACCGHGNPHGAYVVLGGEPDEAACDIRTLTLRGGAATAFFNLLRLGKIEEPDPSLRTGSPTP